MVMISISAGQAALTVLSDLACVESGDGGCVCCSGQATC